jgi:hypothetical protein
MSSIGISLDIHFCRGNIKSIGVFAAAEKCSEEVEITSCDNHSDSDFSKTPCCSNEQFFYQAGNAEKPSNYVNTETTALDLIFQCDGNSETFVFSSEIVLTYNGSDPPLVVKDLNILYDTFLI